MENYYGSKKRWFLYSRSKKKNNVDAKSLCNGICDLQSLYRIERGEQGFSASTFQALMERLNSHHEMFPIFASKTHFKCFLTLKHIQTQIHYLAIFAKKYTFLM